MKSINTTEKSRDTKFVFFFFPKSAKERMISDKLLYSYYKVKSLSEKKAS